MPRSVHDLRDVEHIGDGAYLGHDGYQLWLAAERENGWHMVAVEFGTGKTITDYETKIRQKYES